MRVVIEVKLPPLRRNIRANLQDTLTKLANPNNHTPYPAPIILTPEHNANIRLGRIGRQRINIPPQLLMPRHPSKMRMKRASMLKKHPST
jgi:hypothetical protein